MRNPPAGILVGEGKVHFSGVEGIVSEMQPSRLRGEEPLLRISNPIVGNTGELIGDWIPAVRIVVWPHR